MQMWYIDLFSISTMAPLIPTTHKDNRRDQAPRVAKAAHERAKKRMESSGCRRAIWDLSTNETTATAIGYDERAICIDPYEFSMTQNDISKHLLEGE